MITQHLDAILGIAGTLLGGLLTWGLTSVSASKADAKAERAALQAQFDALLVTVTELQSVAYANHRLYERFVERARTVLLASMAFGGGYARTAHHPKAIRWLGGTGEVARVFGQDRHDAKLATANVTTPMARVFAAAAPLLRHSDRRVVEATQHVLEAAQHIQDRARMEAAIGQFGRVVRAALAPGPSRWKRLTRR